MDQPGRAVRASDAEREHVSRQLGEHAAAGRLTPEELDERLDAAYAARTQVELDRLLDDLPGPPAPRVPDRTREVARAHLAHRAGLSVIACLVCVGIWAAAGASGSFWPIWVILLAAVGLARASWRTLGPGGDAERRGARPRAGARGAASLPLARGHHHRRRAGRRAGDPTAPAVARRAEGAAAGGRAARGPARRRRARGVRDRARGARDRARAQRLRRALRRRARPRDGVRRPARAARPRRRDPARRAAARRPVRHRPGRCAAGPRRPGARRASGSWPPSRPAPAPRWRSRRSPRAGHRRYGIVAPAGEGDPFAMAGVVEKPAPEAAPSRLAIAGRYAATPALLDALRDDAARRRRRGRSSPTRSARSTASSPCAWRPARSAWTSAPSPATARPSSSTRSATPSSGPPCAPAPPRCSMASGSAFARAALAGNPSDGYGGAVLAVCVPELAARAEAQPRGAGAQRPAEHARRRRGRALRARPVRGALGDDGPARGRPGRIERDRHGDGARPVRAARPRRWRPTTLAELVLAVEVEDLGIAAGPQDRYAQAHEGLVLMDFAGARPRVERLDPALLPALYLAWRPDAARDLARRARRPARPRGRAAGCARAWRGSPATRARRRDALRSGDHAAFARALDASFDERAALLELDPRHVAMVQRRARRGRERELRRLRRGDRGYPAARRPRARGARAARAGLRGHRAESPPR